MRTSILTAAFLGLFAFGCAGELNGTGGDDNQTPENCGNGTVDTGETCDDGNTAAGDGCSATCQTEQSQTPKLNVSLDKQAINTELNTNSMITVTLSGEGGFAGNVTLAGSFVETTLTGWTITFDQSQITIPTNGTATAVATVHVPAYNSGLTGTVKIDATSSLGTQTMMSNVTTLNQLTIGVTANGGQCVYPDATSLKLTVKVGTVVRFQNKFQTGMITIHSGGPIPHQPDPGMAVDAYYTNTVNAAGTATWYCHAPGPNPTNDGNVANDPAITVMP